MWSFFSNRDTSTSSDKQPTTETSNPSVNTTFTASQRLESKSSSDANDSVASIAMDLSSKPNDSPHSSQIIEATTFEIGNIHTNWFDKIRFSVIDNQFCTTLCNVKEQFFAEYKSWIEAITFVHKATNPNTIIFSVSENNFVFVGYIDVVLKVLAENYLLMEPLYSEIKNNPQLRNYIDSNKDDVDSPIPAKEDTSEDEEETLPSSSTPSITM